MQAYDLGDVEVIWCNSLGDSLFQTYVMDFVEIVINHYLLITSHVSQAFASCTHYTSWVVRGFIAEFELWGVLFGCWDESCVKKKEILAMWGITIEEEKDGSIEIENWRGKVNFCLEMSGQICYLDFGESELLFIG